MVAANIFLVGDKVRKITGYEFRGVVVATFNKLDGAPRLVVEMTGGCNGNGDGMLHIFSPKQMERLDG